MEVTTDSVTNTTLQLPSMAFCLQLRIYMYSIFFWTTVNRILQSDQTIFLRITAVCLTKYSLTTHIWKFLSPILWWLSSGLSCLRNSCRGKWINLSLITCGFRVRGIMVTLCSNRFCHVTFPRRLDSSHTPWSRKVVSEFRSRGEWGRDAVKGLNFTSLYSFVFTGFINWVGLRENLPGFSFLFSVMACIPIFSPAESVYHTKSKQQPRQYLALSVCKMPSLTFTPPTLPSTPNLF